MQTVNNEIVVENFADTQETIVREFTVQELEQREIDRLAYEQQKVERLAKEAKAQATKAALLDKLGITEDEARLLLGGN